MFLYISACLSGCSFSQYLVGALSRTPARMSPPPPAAHPPPHGAPLPNIVGTPFAFYETIRYVPILRAMRFSIGVYFRFFLNSVVWVRCIELLQCGALRNGRYTATAARAFHLVELGKYKHTPRLANQLIRRCQPYARKPAPQAVLLYQDEAHPSCDSPNTSRRFALGASNAGLAGEKPDLLRAPAW